MIVASEEDLGKHVAHAKGIAAILGIERSPFEFIKHINVHSKTILISGQAKLQVCSFLFSLSAPI